MKEEIERLDAKLKTAKKKKILLKMKLTIAYQALEKITKDSESAKATAGAAIKRIQQISKLSDKPTPMSMTEMREKYTPQFNKTLS